MNHCAVEDSTTNNRIAIDGSYRDFHTDRPMMCRKSESVTLNEPNHCIIGPAHLGGILGYCIQHRLHVCRRAGDHTQNFDWSRFAVPATP